MMNFKSLPFGKKTLFGAWISLEHPSIAEIFTASGVDFVGVCMEHTTISQYEAQRLIAAVQAGGSLCLPRVASHNREQIVQLLDSGADGIIVPNVKRRSEVEKIIEWCKYPPIGKRGFAVGRAQGYGFDFEQNCQTWNQRSSIIIQIESIEGVEAAEELLSHEHVNGAMVGPYDLSGSLGIPGQLEHPRVKEACTHVVEVCRRLGKGCGTQIIDPNETSVEKTLEEGFDFVVLASDIFLLWKWSEHMRALMNGARKGTRVRVQKA